MIAVQVEAISGDIDGSSRAHYARAAGGSTRDRRVAFRMTAVQL